MRMAPRSQMLYGVNQRLRVEDVDSPLCDVRPVKTVMLVCITGDRGLCGGYNNFIIKKVGCSVAAGLHVHCVRACMRTARRAHCSGWCSGHTATRKLAYKARIGAAERVGGGS